MKRITVVEDTPAYLTAFQKVLMDAGHQVSLVWRFTHLEICIEKIVSSQPDIVLLDHDLRASFTGQDVAARLGALNLGCEVISISSGKLDYCTKHFGDKMYLNDESNSSKNDLLALL